MKKVFAIIITMILCIITLTTLASCGSKDKLDGLTACRNGWQYSFDDGAITCTTIDGHTSTGVYGYNDDGTVTISGGLIYGNYKVAVTDTVIIFTSTTQMVTIGKSTTPYTVELTICDD